MPQIYLNTKKLNILIANIFRKLNFVSAARRLEEEEITLDSASHLIHSTAERKSNGNERIWDNNEERKKLCIFPLLHLVKIRVNFGNERVVGPGDRMALHIACTKLNMQSTKQKGYLFKMK